MKVYVRFPQGDWAKEEENGFVRQTGLVGAPFRIDGLVVAVGRQVEGIHPGDTVYGDPRRGQVLVIDDVMYHLMKVEDLSMQAEYAT
jgi:hypothetical protein